MNVISTNQEGWHYAESAMLQDHCDSLRLLASDLRTLAKQVTDRANEIDDKAYLSRKRKFELSRGEWSSDFDKQAKENAGDLDQRIREAAATIEIARVVQTAVNSILKGKHGETCTIQDTQNAADRQGDASAVDAIVSQFTARLLQEHQRQDTLSAKPLSRRQKYIGPNGLPLYMDQATRIDNSRTVSRWKTVNGQNWGKVYSPSLEMDKATHTGLLQHVSKDRGIQRPLIMRAASRLQSNGRDTRE